MRPGGVHQAQPKRQAPEQQKPCYPAMVAAAMLTGTCRHWRCGCAIHLRRGGGMHHGQPGRQAERQQLRYLTMAPGALLIVDQPGRGGPDSSLAGKLGSKIRAT